MNRLKYHSEELVDKFNKEMPKPPLEKRLQQYMIDSKIGMLKRLELEKTRAKPDTAFDFDPHSELKKQAKLAPKQKLRKISDDIFNQGIEENANMHGSTMVALVQGARRRRAVNQLARESMRMKQLKMMTSSMKKDPMQALPVSKVPPIEFGVNAPRQRVHTKQAATPFAPHSMYKNDVARFAPTFEEHLRLAELGYTHTK